VTGLTLGSITDRAHRMAKKPDPKPLMALRHDFFESLSNFTQEVLVLRQVLQQALKYDLITGPAKEMVTEQLAKVAKAMDNEWNKE
jgi:hypothetical protein